MWIFYLCYFFKEIFLLRFPLPDIDSMPLILNTGQSEPEAYLPKDSTLKPCSK